MRLRVKVVAGEVTLYLGGPTAYYGNSDVFSERRTLKALSPARFVDVDFSLNHPTWRNYRARKARKAAGKKPLTLYHLTPQGQTALETAAKVAVEAGVLSPSAAATLQPPPASNVDSPTPIATAPDAAANTTANTPAN